MPTNKKQLLHTFSNGLYVVNAQTGATIEHDIQSVFEGSSVIKIALVLLVVRKLEHEQLSFDTKLRIYKRHRSIGSGALNWTNFRVLTIRDYIYYIGRFSDCVASNVLIEFLGGKTAINAELKKLGYSTTLQMESIQFTEQETAMPDLCHTTPQDMVQLFQALYALLKTPANQSLLYESFTHVKHSWVRANFALSELGRHKIVAKTGSMLEIGKQQDTVLNLVGAVEVGKQQLFFATLNRFSFSSHASQADIDYQKQLILDRLAKAIISVHQKA